MASLSSAQRRARLLELLGSDAGPISGTKLAQSLGVSRQVVVQDCALLRASGSQILGTPRGYLVPPRSAGIRAILASRHDRDQTAEELNIMVDHGLRVLDVVVEHPVYGELRGNLMMSSREDVREFTERLDSGQVTLLSELCAGLHLHSVEAPNQHRLEMAKQELKEHGFLIE